MKHRLISSGSTFEAQIGYSRAVVTGSWVMVSGTTGYDYTTMTLPKDVVSQCKQCLANIAGALKQAGSSLDDVVRVHYIFPKAAEFEPCWSLLREAFATSRPAATMISAQLLNPQIKVEIEVTARVKAKPKAKLGKVPAKPQPASVRPASTQPASAQTDNGKTVSTKRLPAKTTRPTTPRKAQTQKP
jgi:enamine deaminase RidA (YjgF/YER057c/UK114 family)